MRAHRVPDNHARCLSCGRDWIVPLGLALTFAHLFDHRCPELVERNP